MYNTGVVQFLKNGATGHWIKSSSIVCSQNNGKHTHRKPFFPSAFGFKE